MEDYISFEEFNLALDSSDEIKCSIQLAEEGDGEQQKEVHRVQRLFPERTDD